LYRDDCSSYTSPPNYMSSYNQTEMDFGCTGVWYTTGAAPGGGLTPTATIIQAGTYHISCTATFPGLGGIDTKANETVTGTFAVIASSTG